MNHVKTVSGLSLAFILLCATPLLKAQQTAGQTLYRCSTWVQPGIDTSPANSLQEAIDLYAAFAGVPAYTVTCYPVISY